MDMLIIIAFLILGGLLLLLVGFLLWDRLRQGRRWQQQEDALSKAVGDRIDGTIKVFGELKEKLGELTQQTKDIQEVGQSISSLQEALRAPKFRGEFGEVGLETLLMNRFKGSYFLQHRFRDGKIVDAAVQIGEKLVPIDAKFPFALDNFERMVTTQSKEERIRLRRQFVRAIKKHIDDVSEYIQSDEGTFNFALLYIPAENLYYETVARVPELGDESDICSYCRQKRVFLTSPNTFYAYLQTILLGLKGLQIGKFAQEILGHLERLQCVLRDFQEDYELIGKHISSAARKHAEAGTKLTTLSGRLEQLTSEAPPGELPGGDEETSSQPE